MKKQLPLRLLLLILVSSPVFLVGQTNQLPSYDDETAYEVYSAVLSLPETSGPRVPKNYVIRRETLRNFGAFKDTEERDGICLRPEPESEKIIGIAIADYIKVNKTKWRLRDRFRLQIPYQLVLSEHVESLIRRDGWAGFHKNYPDSDGFIDLSAVGFNQEKTVAILSKGGWCGELCGEGAYYVLQKIDGKWSPLDWKGETCAWVS